ncbi:hypothetical protein, partial [Prauserella flavalba]|uniref:hypothetical protein n=1 Tax=Prauserella flavalba TaxID=1477506 RepID=UPI0036E44AB9
MNSSGKRGRLTRRSLLASAIGAAVWPAASANAAPLPRYPSNWPDLEPYGLADTRLDLWPRDDNSFIL